MLLTLGENCPEGHVACDDLSQCIPNEYYCEQNGNEPDCPDDSDERDGCGE